MSATCWKPSVRSRCARRGGRERPRAGPRPRRGRPRGSARRRAPSTTGPCSDERTSSQPTCGCARSAGTSCGWRCVDLLERQPAALLHQVDEPEVARAEHDDVAVGDVVLGPLGLLPGRLADGVADHRALLVAAGDPGDLALGEGALDELVEAVPVALLERRALRLPVVGEDDDLVRPRGVAARALDLREAVVELAQRLERVGALEARVVRDLVVARERRVDGGSPAHHVGQHARHDQVAHEDAQRAAHQRVDAASMPARPHVAADRARGRRPLEDHLPAEQHERARRRCRRWPGTPDSPGWTASPPPSG